MVANNLSRPNYYTHKRYTVFAFRRGHSKIISCAMGTWFEKISPIQILMLTYRFAMKLSYKQTATQYSMGDRPLPDKTICDWCSYCREV